MAESGPVLAVDIGGTKMAAGVTEPGGRLITWAQIPTLRDIDGEQLWRNLEDLVLGVLEDAKVSDPAELSGIGCGCGGPMEWPSGPGLAAEHPGLAAVPAAGAAGRQVRHRRRTGPGAQRRDLHGRWRALAGRGPRLEERAGHGRLDRRRRRA